MSTTTAAHFVVEITEVGHQGERTYTANLSLDVICGTAERAIELMRQAHPEAVVHVVRRIGRGKELIVDD